MSTLLDAVLFAAYCALTVALPGAIAVSWSKSSAKAAPVLLLPAALLAGILIQMAVFMPLRWAGVAYPAAGATYGGLVALLASTWVNGPVRRRGLAILKEAVSADALLFLVLAVALAWYFTYGPIELYYNDELNRLSFAFAAKRAFPAQDPYILAGPLRYYYGLEFFVATAGALTRIPLEIVYFRFLIPLNWLLWFFGTRSVVLRFDERAGRRIPFVVFALFFATFYNLLNHFTVRQNTFALGLSVMSLSALWTGLSESDLGLVILSCLAAAYITFCKATCGALYEVVLCLVLAEAWLRRRLARPAAASCLAVAAAGFLTVYKAVLSGTGFAGTSDLMRVGFERASLEEFFPGILAHDHYRMALASYGLAGRLVWDFLELIEKTGTVLVVSIIPLLAATAWLIDRRRQGPRFLEDLRAVFVLAAVAAFGVGAFLLSFVHYTLSVSSDRYWLYFGHWILSSVAFAAFLTQVKLERLSRRVAAVAMIPLAVALFHMPKYWRIAARDKVYDNDGWTPGRLEACRYIAEHEGPNDLFIENRLRQKNWGFPAFCAHRLYTSQFVGDAVWQEPALYRSTIADTEAFFEGKNPAPKDWLAKNDICYIYWDKHGQAYPFGSWAPKAVFLEESLDNADVTVYRVKDCPQ